EARETSSSFAGGGAGSQNAGAGASVGANLIGDTTTARVDHARLESRGSLLEVRAQSSEVLVSVGLGGAGAEKFALGGSISVNRIQNTIDATVVGGSVSAAADVAIGASDASTLVVFAGAGAGAGRAAVGAAVATAEIEDAV